MVEAKDERTFRTLEEIKARFPPQAEKHWVTVTIGKEKLPAQVGSMVSRNERRHIVYVVPGLIRYEDPDLAAKLQNAPKE